MYRRTLLAGVGGTLLGARLQHAARAAALTRSTLRFVLQTELVNIDPIWGTSYSVRNAALLVWDTLYGVDDKLVPQRQMVEWEEASADGLTWTFRLRPSLMFHDGQPVTAKHVVASLRRWAARDVTGQNIAGVQQDLVALDERSFRWLLKQPFPKMLYALGKSNTPCTFIMPERIANTDPFKVITEYVGSGPMRFVAAEWQAGSKVVFEPFDGYVPRAEPASWMAGGKRMLFDRMEWIMEYEHLDHGYVAPIHKAQGVMVSRAHVLASEHTWRSYRAAMARGVASMRSRIRCSACSIVASEISMDCSPFGAEAGMWAASRPLSAVSQVR